LVKHTEDLLVTKIFSCCLQKDSTLREITKIIYGNDFAKNEIQVYKTVEHLVRDGFVIPVVNGGLKYSVNVDKIISSLVKNKSITQIGKDRFVVNKIN